MGESKTVGITLLGCGTVGGGVVNVLLKQREVIRRRTGVDLVLKHVVVKSEAEFPPNAKELPMSTDAAAAIDDPGTQIVVELIGGTNVAAAFVERALRLGKPVVTANKALLATKGPELFRLARENNTCIAFEASAGGGIPIIDALQRGLIANRVDALVGIVNGTCNFILSQMTNKGWSYDQALKEAQAQGFAEANPTMDVTGRDSAQKLAILASLAFNVRVDEKDIHLEGIDTLDAMDIRYAGELGYVLKLLAIAERTGFGEKESGFGFRGSGFGEEKNAGTSPLPEIRDADLRDPISLRVHPTLVHKDDLLADVSGSFNAISFYGHALGHALFYGRGAGRMPTASAVVADVIAVALGTTPLMFKQLKIFTDTTPAAVVLPMEELKSRYFLRLMVKDQPGVIGAASEILGKHGISIASIQQRESSDPQAVPIVITTHLASEGGMRKALGEIGALATVAKPPVSLRIIDQPREFGGG